MTAEIAVLNKGAIALAADSTMTVTGTGKSYPVNKLFALSRRHPVGAMVYSNSEFMGVPWETLLKMYRRQLSLAGQPTIRAYADDFLRYIGESAACTEEAEATNLRRLATELFRGVRSRVARSLETGSMTNGDDANVRTVVAEMLGALNTRDHAESLAEVDCADFVRRHRDSLEMIAHQCFHPLVLGEQTKDLIIDLLEAFVRSDALSRGCSGVVIAGFGETEFFPSLVQVEVDGMIDGALKVVQGQDYDIARDGLQAAIAPFAQREMVIRFMEGVDPILLDYLLAAATARFQSLASTLLSDTSSEGEAEVDSLAPVIEELSEGLIRDVRDVCRERFADPILTIVQHLPKEELVVMAEALVSLTSLKRRVSEEEESVGGPIDVAVISKGDGFIWSKRKHYFDPKFNPDFLMRTANRVDEPAREAS